MRPQNLIVPQALTALTAQSLFVIGTSYFQMNNDTKSYTMLLANEMCVQLLKSGCVR